MAAWPSRRSNARSFHDGPIRLADLLLPVIVLSAAKDRCLFFVRAWRAPDWCAKKVKSFLETASECSRVHAGSQVARAKIEACHGHDCDLRGIAADLERRPHTADEPCSECNENRSGRDAPGGQRRLNIRTTALTS
jgi:hypothetical protein